MAAGGGSKAIIAAFVAHLGIAIGTPVIGLLPGAMAVASAVVPMARPGYMESDILSTAPHEDAT